MSQVENDADDIIDPTTPEEESDKVGISDEQMIEAIIDYIATTPQNINYNILREMLIAFLIGDDHPYFDYYMAKISQTEESPSEEPVNHPDDDGAITK